MVTRPLTTLTNTTAHLTPSQSPQTAQTAFQAPLPLRSTPTPTTPVQILILGAGWTSTFLIPLLRNLNITYACTTTTGRNGSIPFEFDPDADPESETDREQYARLPDAETVLITFPLKGVGQSRLLVGGYEGSRQGGNGGDEETGGAQAEGHGKGKEKERLYIQLGSTGIYTATQGWTDHKSAYDTSSPRAIAEDELLALSDAPSKMTTPSGKAVASTVLNLAGLWGGERQPRKWLRRIIKKRGDVAGRTSLHLVHGEDVARVIVGCHLHREKVKGQRWIVTDCHVYDWWDLITQWASEEEELRRFAVEGEGEDGGGKEELDLQKTVLELMLEKGVRGLPRSPEQLGRVLDARDVWRVTGSYPSVGRVA